MPRPQQQSLFMDNLMANLDIRLDLARSELALLAATREMEFAREVADRLVFMDAGENVEVVGVATFVNNPETERAKLFQKQILRRNMAMAPIEIRSHPCLFPRPHAPQPSERDPDLNRLPFFPTRPPCDSAREVARCGQDGVPTTLTIAQTGCCRRQPFRSTCTPSVT